MKLFKEFLNENLDHKKIIDYHDEMADEHNEEMHRSHQLLQNPRLSNDLFKHHQKKRDAHQEGYAYHISARNAWKKGNVEKGKELSAKADKFDHDMINKGII